MKSATISKKTSAVGGNLIFIIPKAIRDFLDLKKGEIIEVKISKLEEGEL